MSPAVFALALCLLLITPGPTNTLLAMAGAGDNRGTALRCLFAELAGYLASILPVHALAAPFLDRHPDLARAVTALAALWVLTLSVRLWGRALAPATERAVGPGLVFVTTLLNPKGLVIALALLPRNAGPEFMASVALMLAIIPAVAMLWLTLGATVIRRLSARHPLLVMRTASSALAFFAAGLAVRAAGLL